MYFAILNESHLGAFGVAKIRKFGTRAWFADYVRCLHFDFGVYTGWQ